MSCSFNYLANSSSEFEGDTFDLDVNNLQPYAFEPRSVAESQKQGNTNNNNVQEASSQMRKGNIYWCKCGKCRTMLTEEGSKCCRELDEVPEHYFGDKACISETENFKHVCLTREVLKTILHALNNMRGDDINVSNRSLRYADNL